MRFHASLWAAQGPLVIKNWPADTGDVRDMGSVPGSGRFPGEGNGYPFRYTCLENPMDRGAWWATAHRFTKSESWPSYAFMPAVFTCVMLVDLERSSLCIVSGQGQYLFLCDSRRTLERIIRKWLANCRGIKWCGLLFFLVISSQWLPHLRSNPGRTRVGYWAVLKLRTLS